MELEYYLFIWTKVKLDPLFHTTYAKIKDKKSTQSHKLNNENKTNI